MKNGLSVSIGKIIQHTPHGVCISLRPPLRAFWNRWTLGLDSGPDNAGLWTDISAQKHTEFGSRYITLDPCVSGLKVLDSSDKSTHYHSPSNRGVTQCLDSGTPTSLDSRFWTRVYLRRIPRVQPFELRGHSMLGLGHPNFFGLGILESGVPPTDSQSPALRIEGSLNVWTWAPQLLWTRDFGLGYTSDGFPKSRPSN